jgi:hypothetical protein
MVVQNGIRPTQAAALDSPGVRVAQDSFYTVLRSAMIEKDPTAAELLDRSRQIGAALDRVAGPVITAPDQANQSLPTRSEREAVSHELVTLERELRPQIERAMERRDVADAFSALQDSVLVTMRRIDPNTETSIQRLSEIAERMREIDNEIALLEGGH